MATVLIPMFSAEMAPKNIRSQLGSIFQFFFTMGVMTSYWVDYAVGKHLEPSTRQWQIPVGLQLVPGGILGLGMLLCKESTRWLAKRGRNEEALQSLIWVRGGEDTPEVRQEYVLHPTLIVFSSSLHYSSSGLMRFLLALRKRSAQLKV